MQIVKVSVSFIVTLYYVLLCVNKCGYVPQHYRIVQGSSTFQIVRATLTISMMPAGHKAIHDVHVHIIGKRGRSVNLTTNRCIMCRQRAGLVFVVIFLKRPAGHGKGLRGPRVEDPWYSVWYGEYGFVWLT
jgi:hypothetical protein